MAKNIDKMVKKCYNFLFCLKHWQVSYHLSFVLSPFGKMDLE